MDCLDSTWISSKGEYIKKFEDQFAKFIGDGGGHKDAAGCPLNDKFLELMKEFMPYE